MTDPAFRRQGVLTALASAAQTAWAAAGYQLQIGVPWGSWGSRRAALGWIRVGDLIWVHGWLAPERALARHLGLPVRIQEAVSAPRLLVHHLLSALSPTTMRELLSLTAGTPPSVTADPAQHPERRASSSGALRPPSAAATPAATYRAVPAAAVFAIRVAAQLGARVHPTAAVGVATRAAARLARRAAAAAEPAAAVRASRLAARLAQRVAAPLRPDLPADVAAPPDLASDPTFRVRRLSAPEPALDALWAAAAPRWEHAVVRDAAWLAWRYFAAPGGPYRVLVAESDTQPLGYVAFKIEASPGRAVRGWIADLLTVAPAASARAEETTSPAPVAASTSAALDARRTSPAPIAASSSGTPAGGHVCATAAEANTRAPLVQDANAAAGAGAATFGGEVAATSVPRGAGQSVALSADIVAHWLLRAALADLRAAGAERVDALVMPGSPAHRALAAAGFRGHQGGNFAIVPLDPSLPIDSIIRADRWLVAGGDFDVL
jgi:hypothetical protein